MRLVECVPNFSEGRDKAKVEAIAAAVRSAAGVRVLDVETDPDHNRCVLSFVAPVEAAVEAAFRGAKRAVELIDLNLHKGEHPRMGAVDVIPFIPVAGTTIADCSALAAELGARIGSELGVPVYLYDRAARRPERADLAKVRKGQFEGLREELGKNPDRDPDFGPRRIHPTAGAVAVGAREQIINFNLNLKGVSMEAAKGIAKKVRTSGGGLPSLRAKEIALAAPAENGPRAAQGLAQISTVLTDYRVTSLAA
ncbi:MAG: glutamate formimidoyltransferase, partial [Elusimicrobiota bacterium]